MKHRPIHENLDTSFVNLSALVRYLRRRQFVGQVRVELSGYEADIFLGEANHLRAREHDQIAGRIAEGEEALQRILIRSREPGGIVHVYQEIKEGVPAETEIKAAAVALPTPTATHIPKPPATHIPQPSVQMPRTHVEAAMPPVAVAELPQPKPKISLPDLPLEFTNNVEEKRRAAVLSPQDWQTLLDLTGELLETIDKTLAAAHLDFPAAFQKARAEVAIDYPFLNPATDVFRYQDGKISLRDRPGAKLFTASMLEILQRILEKLYSNPKFNILYRHTTQRIRALAEQRKPLYDKFFITGQLEKLLK